MGRGCRYPQAVQLQIRRPEPGLGDGICFASAPIKKSSTISWADMSSETHSSILKEQSPPTLEDSAAPAWSEMGEIYAAIESLYCDELKPYCRILRKRLTERAEVRGEATLDISVELLRTLCDASTKLWIEVEESGEWSATFVGRAPTFVNVYSSQDLYAAALWANAAAYFEGIDDSNSKLPGGRYACAQALVARRLPFLDGYTLGQVSHIVQLAISQKKILGYSTGVIVPYGRSQSMMKDRCAEQRAPILCPSVTSANALATGCGDVQENTSVLSVATWQVFRRLLQQILKDAVAGSKSHVPISNVKRIFRSRYQIDLSETALGHSKLSELLQDPKISDVCALKLNGRGYVVVPVEELHVEKTVLPCGTGTWRDAPCFLGPLAKVSHVEATVRNTFIHFHVPIRSTRKRAASVPKDFLPHPNKTGQMDVGCTDAATSAGSTSSDVSCRSDDGCSDSHLHPFGAFEPEMTQESLAAFGSFSTTAAEDHFGTSGLSERNFYGGVVSTLRESRSPDFRSMACRTPSPSPSPRAAMQDCQDLLSTYTWYTPPTFVFASPCPQHVRLADLV